MHVLVIAIQCDRGWLCKTQFLLDLLRTPLSILLLYSQYLLIGFHLVTWLTAKLLSKSCQRLANVSFYVFRGSFLVNIPLNNNKQQTCLQARVLLPDLRPCFKTISTLMQSSSHQPCSRILWLFRLVLGEPRPLEEQKIKGNNRKRRKDCKEWWRKRRKESQWRSKEKASEAENDANFDYG